MARRGVRRLAAVTLALVTSAALPWVPARAHQGGGSDQARLEKVDFKQRIGAPLPADTHFFDADGKRQAIAVLADERPMVLIMAWLDCPNLCPIILGETARSAAALPFAREDYRVTVVSIAPGDGPADARAVRQRLRQRHGEIIDNWRFLTGTKAAIDRLAQAVGFEYAYDAEDERYAHPAGLVVTAAGGEVSRYLFGLRPEPQNLKLALVDAGQGKVGSATDQVLLRCFRFNPQTGEYTVAVMRLFQWIGGGFGLAMGGTIFWMWRRERNQSWTG